MIRCLPASLAALWMVSTAAFATDPQPEEWVFLDNGQLRVGLNRSAGGAIGWFSESRGSANLLNHYDKGRYLQQSWYGRVDGSDWNGKAWRWNPVQAGGWRGEKSELLAYESGPNRLHTRTRPRHWASGALLSDVEFEQTVVFVEDRLIRIRFHMRYKGAETHPEHDQELPACFVDPALDTLVLYDGETPWTGAPLSRSTPGWPNETRAMTEHWAAWIDPTSGRGIGLCVPAAERLTCYRFGKMGAPGSCSYLAPIRRMAIGPDFDFEYDVFLTLGTPEEMRERFRRVIGQG
ncbi:MAG: hypothetical protein H7A52_12090 [Akkermansiaceae bacterium]|nr:hypothetical protein [Akkermansiaceae bacterium]